MSYSEQIMSVSTKNVQDFVDSGTAAVKKNSNFREFVRRVCLNKAALISFFVIVIIVLLAILAPVIAPEGYDAQDLLATNQAPSWSHPFGTDHLGRDILSRILWGSRYSLSVGLISILLAAATGVILGLISGFFGGTIDDIIMRICDVFMAIPQILLAICISAALGAGLFNLLLATSISTIPGFTRMCRASVLSVREQEFTEAARCSGAKNIRIMFKYILPNVLSPIIVQVTMGIAGTILVASSMSFLGLGLQPPAPEWGAMLSASRTYIRLAPWSCLFPGLAIAITVLAFNLLGDGMRDALDPKLKR